MPCLYSLYHEFMVYLQGGRMDLCQKCLPLKMHLYRETFSSKECNIIILNIYEKFHATDVFKLPFFVLFLVHNIFSND